MRVLVTGASGHVGGAIRQALLAAGHDVASPGRATGLDLAAPDVAAQWRAIAPCAAIVHAAAVLSGAATSRTLVATNVEGTRSLLEASAEWRARVFVLVSSIAVLGAPSPGGRALEEDGTPSPRTPYAATKLLGEHLVTMAGEAAPRRLALRLTAPVGRGMAHGRLLPVLVRRALAGEPLRLQGEGSREQDYIDARDIARAVTLALREDASAAGVLHIASGRPLSNRDLARRVLAVTRSRAAVEFTGEPDAEEGLCWRVSVEKAARELGFRAAIPIEESISEVAAGLCA